MQDNKHSLVSVLARQSGSQTRKLTVTIVGKGNSHTGMGRLTHAWLQTLAGQPHLVIRFVNTRPDEGDDVGYPHVLKISEETGHAQPGDVAIFTDVLWNGHGDSNYTKCPVAKLKYCYCVFDSTHVPAEWISIANGHFDAVLVTSPFLRKVFLDSGLLKPVIELQLALDLEPFFRIPNRIIEKSYVFGAVGAYDFRKNVHLITDAFEQAFGLDNPNVKLRLKMTYTLFGDEAASEFAARFRGTNVEVTQGRLDNQAYLDYVSGIDCMINLSRGEGYSIPIREAVALGKPIILTDHFAHEDLAGIDSAKFVRAEIPVPALYPQINERYIGLQFLPHTADVVEAFEEVYENRAAYQTRAAANRERAKIWSVGYLAPRYFALVSPPSIMIRGGPDQVSPAGISVTAEYFYRRAASVYGNTVARSIRNAELLTASHNKVVVVGHDGGFLSLFNRYVSYLVWEKDTNSSCLILPDWRADSIRDFFDVPKFTSFCYASPSEGNAWLKLFEPSPDVGEDLAIYNDVDRLYDGAVIADGFNEYREPWLTYTHAYRLYQMPEFRRWRQWYHSIVAKHVRPRAAIVRRVEANMKKMGRGTRLAVHIRHPSHAIEQPGARLSHVDSYVRAIGNYIQINKITEPKIFLATDQDSTIEMMRKQFGNALYYDNDVKRTSSVQDQRFSELDGDLQMAEGHQIQHLTAADPNSWSSKMAEEVLADCYSMAGCDVMFHVVSNISTAVSYLNPKIEMVFVGNRYE